MAKDQKAHVGQLNAGIVGCDDDGHKRITRGPNILVVGGCQEGHEKGREIIIRANEALDRKGREVSRREFRDIMDAATDKSS